MQNRPLRILGIDPGYDRLGYAVVEEGKKPTVLVSGCLETPKTAPHAERLQTIATFLPTLISEYTPDGVATESLFFSKNQKTAIKVAEARGVILTSIHAAGLEVIELNPMSVKVALTGHGKSDKQQVILMVQRLCNIPIQKNNSDVKKIVRDDEYDAIAIAVAGLLSYPHKQRERSLLQK
ncbi:MAG TPA: crossover junction endodeoxyribonuclease RuvC [Candidatus Paceibacterota bacterium]|nr:crossover junction endodeoxyribonuclease RuvC [Candidatus Paceibacterota bacterium]